MVVAKTMNIDMNEKRRGPRTELCAPWTFESQLRGDKQKMLKRGSCRGRKGKQRAAT